MTTARAAPTARAVAAAASEMPVEPELSSFALTARFTWPAEAKEEGSSRVKADAPLGSETGVARTTLEACRVRWYLLRGSVTHAAARCASRHRADDGLSVRTARRRQTAGSRRSTAPAVSSLT